jgi:hypothetical protein
MMSIPCCVRESQVNQTETKMVPNEAQLLLSQSLEIHCRTGPSLLDHHLQQQLQLVMLGYLTISSSNIVFSFGITVTIAGYSAVSLCTIN